MPDSTEAPWPGQDPGRPPAERRGRTAFSFKPKGFGLGSWRAAQESSWGISVPPTWDRQWRAVSRVLLLATPAVRAACTPGAQLSQPRSPPGQETWLPAVSAKAEAELGEHIQAKALSSCSPVSAWGKEVAKDRIVPCRRHGAGCGVNGG